MMEELSLVKEVLPYYKGERDQLIPILQKVQEALGYIPEDVIVEIAKHLKITPSQVYSVASFYAQFRLMPLGRKRIAVCRGTACHIRGTPQILKEIEKTIGIKEGETSEDLEHTLETVACIGCCALAPCTRINDEVHGRLTPGAAREIFAKLEEEEGGG